MIGRLAKQINTAYLKISNVISNVYYNFFATGRKNFYFSQKFQRKN